MSTTVIQRIVICIAVITSLGILIHDTKFDKAVKLALPVATVAFGLSSHALDLGGNAHTHVERASLSHVFAGVPRIVPAQDRKYNLERFFGKNSYFGGSGVVWPSV